ncbi:MAG: TIGR02099 family protein [Xanthomonadaceae bacterium]|nr:TIGR02099 family protein [Xanthomonadaceae bacterium]
MTATEDRPQPSHPRPSRRSPWRRLRFAVGALAATLLILLALGMAVGQILLPLAARYPERVAALLSARLGRPVSFARMSGVARPSGPELTLTDLRLGATAHGAAFVLPQARLRFDFGRLLLPDRHWIVLSVDGLDLRLQRAADGRWSLLGFSSGGAVGEGDLSSLPVDLALSRLRLTLATAVPARQYHLLADAALLSSHDGRLRFGALLRRAGMAQDLRISGVLAGNGRSGRIYLAGNALDLGLLLRDADAAGYALQRGAGSIEAWVDWHDGRLTRAVARLDLQQLDLSGPQGRHAALPRLAGLADLRRTAGGWQFDYRNPAARGVTPGSVSVAWAGAPGGALRARLRARNLELAPLLPLAGLAPQAGPGLADWLARAAPRGRVDRFDLDWAGVHDFDFDGRLDGLGFAAVGRLPGIDALSATVRGDAEAIALELPSQPLTLRYPHVFRQPLAIAALDATLALWRGDAGWHLGIAGLRFDAADFAGSARGEIGLRPGSPKPLLDLAATVRRGNVAAAKLFWPINVMPPGAVKWLDRALVGGSLDDGRIVFRGDTADWPFRDGQGRFAARARFHAVTLAYSDEWPAAQGLDGTARFVDDGLTAEADAGSTLGNPLGHAVARIPDLNNAVLTLAAQGEGRNPQLMDFVRQSPIGRPHADVLRGLKIGGRARWQFTLVLPVHDVKSTVIEGQAELAAASLEQPRWQLAIRDIAGPLTFDRRGLDAAALSGRFRGQPATLALAIGGDTGDPATALKARLTGTYDVPTLIRGYDVLKPFATMSTGAAPVTLGLTVATPPGAATTATTLSVDSELQGIAITLPAPLAKPAAQPLSLHLAVALPFAGHTVRAQLGSLLAAQVRIPAQGAAVAALALGGAALPAYPAAGISVAGHAATLDISGWALHGMGGAPDAPRLPLTANIRTDVAEVFGRRFKDLTLQARSDAVGLHLQVSGPAAQGRVDIPLDLQRAGITADLERLYWPDEAKAAGNAAAAPAPMADVAPASVPPLHLRVGDFRLGQAQFGSARFESVPGAGGMRIEQLDTHSPNVQMTARGTWTGAAAASRTAMVIDFSAEDLGHMLAAFGYPGLVAGGRTVAHLDASWPGAPSAFAFAALDGSLKVDVSSGRVLEVQPGVGRLFGLLSIAELPRRLTLDFGDVFAKGLAFDSIRGSFALGDGNATTPDLEIKGPAADISVRGRTGLRAHDYDQTVVVHPKVGSTLPILGAIAGGPIGAAAGLAMQGLLGKGLSHAAGTTYRITGSWDHPKIVRLPDADERKSAPRPGTSGG